MKTSPGQTTMKVWRTTLKNLRQLHDLTGETMIYILDRLVKAELEAVSKGDDRLERS